MKGIAHFGDRGVDDRMILSRDEVTIDRFWIDSI